MIDLNEFCSIAISRCGLLEFGDYRARGRTQQSSDLSIPIFDWQTD
jgi:hypothetical protein